MGKLFGNNASQLLCICLPRLPDVTPAHDMAWHHGAVANLTMWIQFKIGAYWHFQAGCRQASGLNQRQSRIKKSFSFSRPTRMHVEKKKSFPFLDRLVCLSRKRNRARSNHLFEDLSTDWFACREKEVTFFSRPQWLACRDKEVSSYSRPTCLLVAKKKSSSIKSSFWRPLDRLTIHYRQVYHSRWPRCFLMFFT